MEGGGRAKEYWTYFEHAVPCRSGAYRSAGRNDSFGASTNTDGASLKANHWLKVRLLYDEFGECRVWRAPLAMVPAYIQPDTRAVLVLSYNKRTSNHPMRRET